MTPRAIALMFVERFCAGDVEGLAPLLAEDMTLEGPFHRLDSAEAYLQVLRADPPEPSGYRVRSVTEAEGHVSVYYDLLKGSGTLTVAQLFRIRESTIRSILLVFDGREADRGAPLS